MQGLSMSQNLKANLLTGAGMPPLGLFAVYGSRNDTSVREVKAILTPLQKAREKHDRLEADAEARRVKDREKGRPERQLPR